jgi:hypothetical protein
MKLGYALITLVAVGPSSVNWLHSLLLTMDDTTKTDNKPRLETIEAFLEAKGIPPPVRTIEDYIGVVRQITDDWQKEDWIGIESDEDYVMNDARIVGQVWFRGHRDCRLSLRPGLYREATRAQIGKQAGSPFPQSDVEDPLFPSSSTLNMNKELTSQATGIY